MGEISDIINLVKGARGCSDAVMMDVVMEPSEIDQAREDLVVKSGDLFLPAQSPWREKTLGGVALNNDAHQVFANHYFLDPAALPKRTYLYNVAIFRYTLGDELKADDLAKEGKEQRVNMALVKQLLQQNKQNWLLDGSVGVSYDGGSTLVTTAQLPLGAENRTAEKVQHPEDSKSTFSVALLLVKSMDLPDLLRTSKGEAVLPGSQWTTAYKPTIQALDVALLAFARWQSGDPNPQWLLSGSKVFK